jgi:recombinational DNA repair protein RecR
MYPNSIKNVIDCLKDLPGIGEKTAERLAFSLINFDKDKLTLFSESICGVRDKITNCQICGNICESDVCPICLDKESIEEIHSIIDGVFIDSTKAAEIIYGHLDISSREDLLDIISQIKGELVRIWN